MAQPTGKTNRQRPAPQGKPGPKRPPRTAVQYGPSGSALSKQAAAGKIEADKKNKNKTQIIIGAVALVVIAAVVVTGILLNKSNTGTKNDGYGLPKSSVAALSGGVITVSAGQAPKQIDVYEDLLCPYCGLFERQYGQQIAQAVDEGKLAVNYHLLNFLDKGSSSGNYSTRAAAALYCTAENLGAVKGVWSSLHATLYDESVQPAENSSSDLTNDDLIARMTSAAEGLGVAADSPDLAAAKTCVTSGEMLGTVASSYATSAATLNTLTGGVRSPVVASGATVLNIDDGNWLTTLIGA